MYSIHNSRFLSINCSPNNVCISAYCTTGIHVNVIYTCWHGRPTDFTLTMISKNREYRLRGSPISKALTILVRKFTCTNKNGNFVKETDTSGYSVV